ncbi:MAG: peptidoglycan-binding domain-containing protein [Polyangiales bacterium]
MSAVYSVECRFTYTPAVPPPESDLREVQQLLRDAGFAVSVTGRFDDATRGAVREYQLQHFGADTAELLPCTVEQLRYESTSASDAAGDIANLASWTNVGAEVAGELLDYAPAIEMGGAFEMVSKASEVFESGVRIMNAPEGETVKVVLEETVCRSFSTIADTATGGVLKGATGAVGKKFAGDVACDEGRATVDQSWKFGETLGYYIYDQLHPTEVEF